MGDSLEQDLPWSGWMLSLFFVALLLACAVASSTLVVALGGRGAPNEDRKICATTVVMVGVSTLAFARWPLFLNILAFCALLIVCTVVSMTCVGWVGGRKLSTEGEIGLTVVAILSLVALAFARRSIFLNILALFALVHVCAIPSIWLVFHFGGGGANVDLYVGVTIAVMLGLGALAFTQGWLFFYLPAYCALLTMSMAASALVTEALGLGFPKIDKHVCVVTVVVWSLRALVNPIQPILDDILTVGAVLVLSTASSSVLVLALGVLDAELRHRMLCGAALALSAAFGASFKYQRHEICGCILVLIALLVPRAKSAWRSLRVDRALQTPETRLRQIQKQMAEPKRGWAMRFAILTLATFTGGLSNLVYFPYEIAVGNQRRLLQAEFERLRFRLVDAYYCEGRDRVPGAITPADELLMSREDWKSAKTRILTKVKEAAERLSRETRSETQFVYIFQEVFTDAELETPIEKYEATFLQVEIAPDQPATDVWLDVVFICLIGEMTNRIQGFKPLLI